jgi:signal transduction histidine kinase
MKNMRWTTRLILLVIGLVLFAGVVSGGLALHNTSALFENYLARTWHEQAVHMSELIVYYYEENGSLVGISDIMEFSRGGGIRRGQGMIFTRGMGSANSIISDPEGKILWSQSAENINEVLELEKEPLKYPVNSDGQVIAFIIPDNNMYRSTITLEGQYLTSVLISLVWGTVISVLIAIFLGVFFSKSLLQPLRNLIKAAREFSSGNLDYRVKEKAAADINEVYTAFNEMAEKLARQEKLRRDLVADVAHELRTPLTILSGNLEAMQDGIEEVNPIAITSLHDEVLRLRALVDDLQQLTLAEAKKLHLNYQETDLSVFLQETMAFFEAEAKEKGISMLFDTKDDLPLLNIDRARIRQVFINLLSNALRYTSVNGRVGIRLESRDGIVDISVYDNGPGIAVEDLPYVFERFYRGDKARSRQSGGTGLGLAIVKSFIEAHGGNIEVESHKGVGTTFNIKIPI